MFTQDMTNRYEVVTYGRNHYVTDTVTHEFSPSVAYTSKKKAQQRCDEKNADV